MAANTRHIGSGNSPIDEAELLLERIRMKDAGFLSDRDLTGKNRLETELTLYKSNFAKLLRARMADRENFNARPFEHQFVGEQTYRESRLLKATNQMLEQVFSDPNEQALSKTFIRLARDLTNSPFGFVVTQQENRCWQMVTEARQSDERAGIAEITSAKRFEMNRFWLQLIKTGQAFMTQSPLDGPVRQPLPGECHNIKTFLAAPFPADIGIQGFIALADNPNGYSCTDRIDVQTLAQAFTKVVRQARLERSRQSSEKRLHLALESAGEGLWDYQPQQDRIYFSPRWLEMVGYQPGDLPYRFDTWITLTHPEDLPILENTFKKAAQKGESAFQAEIRMLSEKGQWRWFQVRGRTVEQDGQGVVLRMVGTLIDISRHKQVELALQKANDELLRLAALDDLTQIANRRRFDERLAEEWRRARRDNTHMAVIICDIDYFKNYNDTYGHVKGDEALYAVAQAINGVLKRPMDLVARYGGEEFALVLPNTDLTGATRVAKKIKAAVQNLSIEHRDSAVSGNITLSFGLSAEIPGGSAPARSLVEQADEALYQAKAQGRNRIAAITEKK